MEEATASPSVRAHTFALQAHSTHTRAHTRPHTDLSSTRVEEVAPLARCRRLRRVYLGGTAVSDAECLLTRCPLRTLQVWCGVRSCARARAWVHLECSQVCGVMVLATCRPIGRVRTPHISESLGHEVRFRRNSVRLMCVMTGWPLQTLHVRWVLVRVCVRSRMGHAANVLNGHDFID